jgi:hypothetical protein
VCRLEQNYDHAAGLGRDLFFHAVASLVATDAVSLILLAAASSLHAVGWSSSVESTIAIAASRLTRTYDVLVILEAAKAFLDNT